MQAEITLIRWKNKSARASKILIPHWAGSRSQSLQVLLLFREPTGNCRIHISMYMFVQGCMLPPALHPSDSIKSDRWSQPVQDSEHERPVSPPSFLQIIKLRIVSQNKCQKLWRLNVVVCWAHTGLTFPAESIPPLTAPLHPGLRPSPQLLPCVWHSDVMLIIMTLTLPLTFTLFYFYCCKQMQETRHEHLSEMLL